MKLDDLKCRNGEIEKLSRSLNVASHEKRLALNEIARQFSRFIERPAESPKAIAGLLPNVIEQAVPGKALQDAFRALARLNAPEKLIIADAFRNFSQGATIDSYARFSIEFGAIAKFSRRMSDGCAPGLQRLVATIDSFRRNAEALEPAIQNLAKVTEAFRSVADGLKPHLQTIADIEKASYRMAVALKPAVLPIIEGLDHPYARLATAISAVDIVADLAPNFTKHALLAAQLWSEQPKDFQVEDFPGDPLLFEGVAEIGNAEASGWRPGSHRIEMLLQKIEHALREGHAGQKREARTDRIIAVLTLIMALLTLLGTCDYTQSSPEDINLTLQGAIPACPANLSSKQEDQSAEVQQGHVLVPAKTHADSCNSDIPTPRMKPSTVH